MAQPSWKSWGTRQSLENNQPTVGHCVLDLNGFCLLMNAGSYLPYHIVYHIILCHILTVNVVFSCV